MKAVAFLLGTVACVAGPKEFGLIELNQALTERKLEMKVVAELGTDPPETFQIEPFPGGHTARITGGDLRGLMYGLIEAAEQIRESGKLSRKKGEPAIALRGVRFRTGDPESLNADWRAKMRTLALARFNRVTVALERVPNDSEAHRLRILAAVAADYGVDFVLGLPAAESGEALLKVIAACPMIRGIEVPAASLSAAQRAQRDAGRLISIDLVESPAGSTGALAVRSPISLTADASLSKESVRRTLAAVDRVVGFKLESAAGAEPDATFYRTWGRMAYEMPSASAANKQ